ncbi:MAG: methylglyoxal synthase [Bacteroidota bacterium]
MNIALVAHDEKKEEMVAWVTRHYEFFSQHQLFATGTTGTRIMEKLPISVHCYKSGPYGGDQQIGAAIVEGNIHMLFFFWDPMWAQPHDVDVKALLRLSTYYNIPTACNIATADFLLMGLAHS